MIDWIERNRPHIIVTLINLALIGAVFLWDRTSPPDPITIVSPSLTPISTPVASVSATPAGIRVYVTGAVMFPDVYEIPAGSIVKDIVDKAGGAVEEADLTAINLALKLQDQQMVYVPYQGETDVDTIIRGGQLGVEDRSVPELSSTIDINRAGLEDLCSLPGIGPELAERIISYREANGPFQSIQEIINVSGIGDATFEKIKDCITVGG